MKYLLNYRKLSRLMALDNASKTRIIQIINFKLC